MIEALKKYESLRSVIQRCDEKVLGILQESNVSEAEIAAESFKNGGKRLRPALMILCSMAPAGSSLEEIPESLIDLAAAVELIHLATLFHDDVIDEVETRRTKLSARAKYGNYRSVLAGDYVLAEALLLVNQCGLAHTLPDFLRTIRVLIRGESRETAHQFDFDLNEAIYYEIISEKSASLFALSCKVGGMSQHPEYADVLGHFGWNLGMAFQLIDDLDDMLDLPNSTTDCDLKNGYLALPVIRALNGVEDGHRDSLVGLIRRGEFTPEVERQIVLACNEHGGISYTHCEIEKHLDHAAQAITRFESSDATRLLTEITRDLRAYTEVQVAGFLRFSGAPS
jgi:geranylgeranyl pyrophosphate synthase